ncbi:hypothetical protein MY11210_003472 [Beauveria gryllotalpidicola]
MATAARWPASLASSREDMINWNPDVSTTVDGTFYDCINLWPQQQICVGVTPPNPLPTPRCNANAPLPRRQGHHRLRLQEMVQDSGAAMTAALSLPGLASRRTN